MRILLTLFLFSISAALAARVKHCYLCQGNCTAPLQTDDCEKSLTQNKTAATSCISIKFPIENKIWKGCSYKEKAIADCSSDSVSTAQCYHCDKDLCNQSDSADYVRTVSALIVTAIGLTITFL